MKKTLFAASIFLSCIAFASQVTGDMAKNLLVSGSGRAYLMDPSGKILWEQKNCGNIHRSMKYGDWIYYSNGNVYRVNTKTGAKELFYSPCPKEGVFGFEILPGGNMVVAENGTDYIAELEAETKKPLVRFKGDPASKDGKTPNAHHHYRMIRKTPQGTYLVACSGANTVKEYGKDGKLVWEQETPQLAFEAIRRANGNTLVSHLTAVTEYTPDHKIVWSFKCGDIPELNLANLCGIQELPNGNLVIGTYSNGKKDGSRTTALEITRDKKVVWKYCATGDRSMMTAFLVD
jgi:outer membrane protein assembly factor BamB